MRAKRHATALAAISIAAAVAPGVGSATEPGPQETVRGILDQAKAVVEGEGSRNDKLRRLHTLAGDLIDAETMGRNALGEVLEQASPESQAEFLDLFGALVVRAYLQKLLFFRKPDFEYVGLEVEGDAARVETRILTRKDAFQVDYRGWAPGTTLDLAVLNDRAALAMLRQFLRKMKKAAATPPSVAYRSGQQVVKQPPRAIARAARLSGGTEFL